MEKQLYRVSTRTVRPVAFRHPISWILVFSWMDKFTFPHVTILEVFESSRGVLMGRFWVFGLIPDFAISCQYLHY
jgi:hypothetical protein